MEFDVRHLLDAPFVPMAEPQEEVHEIKLDTPAAE